MTNEAVYIEFDPGSPDEVVAAMDRLAASHAGWINFEPAVAPEDVPDDPGVFNIFSARGRSVPLGTWTPGSVSRRGRSEPAMIGLQHGAGTRAKPLLAEVGHPVPTGWTVTQDHAKKGLVVVLPPTTPHVEVLNWLLNAAPRLSPTPLAGGWRASVYG